MSSSDAFLLTRPLRDVTGLAIHFKDAQNISTHTPLAGRDAPLKKKRIQIRISTHTPLAGRDIFFCSFFQLVIISTHTPLAGRDHMQIPL